MVPSEFAFASARCLLENGVRKILFVLAICFSFTSLAPAVEMNLPLVDGSSVVGEVMKFDDNGIMLRTAGETYTNLAWARFSQDALKQLAANPKIKVLVEPFIEPEASQRTSTKAEITINPVVRSELPANPSLLGGLFKSPVGLFILFVIYLANLFAAYEISIVKARSGFQVIGVAALLPIIGPVIFLILPMKTEAPPEEIPFENSVADADHPPKEAAVVAEASWKKEEAKVEPQIFARGKFTFNKRFLETKFAGFVGELKGDALKFSMSAKTGAGQFAVERIAQIGAQEIIFETPNGQVTVPFVDIQEITLNPKTF
jgi:hypothetical protein